MRRALAFSVIGLLLLTGCGGGGGSSTNREAEAHNKAVIGGAETSAESAAEIHKALVYKLGLYEYAGVEEVFALPNGSRCDIQQVLTSQSDLEIYDEEPNTLLAPDGKAGVEVGTFQGTEEAPCLTAVAEALRWAGKGNPPAPSGLLTKQEYIKRADAICKRQNNLAEELFGEEESYEESAESLSAFRLPLIHEIEALEALESPASIVPEASSYVSLLGAKVPYEEKALQSSARIDAASSVGEKIDPKDETELESAERQESANFEKRHKLAADIGLKECAS